jgi:hypothetical protein
LDNSMVLFGSSMADGNAHNPDDLCFLLGGKAGGALTSGRHLASPKDTSLCNLYVSMLHCMGLNEPSFGDSTGPLKVLPLRST